MCSEILSNISRMVIIFNNIKVLLDANEKYSKTSIHGQIGVTHTKKGLTRGIKYLSICRQEIRSSVSDVLMS